MTDIAGGQFSLTFEPQGSTRELVLVGVVPIGGIELLGGGQCCYSIYLPMIDRKMRGASSIESARDQVRALLEQWFEAAAARHVARTITRRRERPAAVAARRARP
jgi:hypothetical protein